MSKNDKAFFHTIIIAGEIVTVRDFDLKEQNHKIIKTVKDCIKRGDGFSSCPVSLNCNFKVVKRELYEKNFLVLLLRTEPIPGYFQLVFVCHCLMFATKSEIKKYLCGELL